MGLAGKLESEVEIKSSAHDYFHAWIDHGALFSKAIPDDYHKSEVHEGDGKSLGSINSYNYVLEGDTVLNCKAKMEAIDEENKSLTLDAHDGHVAELYKKYKLNVQVVTKDGKNFAKCTIDYEKVNEEAPTPTKYMDLTTKFSKGLDDHLIKG